MQKYNNDGIFEFCNRKINTFNTMMTGAE
jgi:hypothetical protein